MSSGVFDLSLCSLPSRGGKGGVEVDGGIHETQKDYDKLRDWIISRNDITVLRFSNEEVVNQFDIVAKRIGELRPPSPDLSGESLH